MKVILASWNRSATRSGTTVGYGDALLPEVGVRIHGVCIKRNNAGVFALLPHVPKLKGQRVLRRAGGQGIYEPAVSFISASDLEAFSEAFVAAVLAAHPEVAK
jgi:hypothetical protein